MHGGQAANGTSGECAQNIPRPVVNDTWRATTAASVFASAIRVLNTVSRGGGTREPKNIAFASVNELPLRSIEGAGVLIVAGEIAAS
jgi:hypothetical protein